MAKSIVSDPEILGGEPVFSGTRVPFKGLTDYLEGGNSRDDFLEQDPSVARDLAVAAIEEARLSLIAQLQGESCWTNVRPGSEILSSCYGA